MSGLFFEYRASSGLGDVPFYALVMAAMRRADDLNVAKLREAWPEVWEELQARYEAPGGVLDSDADGLKVKVWGSTVNPRP